MIDNIYMLNVPEETERLRICTDELHRCGVPTEKIKVWEAKSHKPFAKSRDLCEAAAADGFAFFQIALEIGLHNNCFIGYLAQAWNYFSFMRYIVETNETSILLHDDSYFACAYKDLVKACSELPNQDKFHLASLSVTSGENYELPQWLHSKSCWEQGLREIDSVDWGVLYSPKGAAFFLERSVSLVEHMFGNWSWAIFWRDITLITHPHIYSLTVAPTPTNIKNIEEIHRIIKENLTKRPRSLGYFDYSAVLGIVGVKSTLHDKNCKYIRPIGATKD